MSNQNIRPSRWYYALGILVFIAGAVLFTLFLIKSLSGLTDALLQVVVPGKSDITLSEIGRYTVFYEHQSVVGNKVYSTGEGLSGLQCALKDKATGSPVTLSRPAMSSTYSVGGRRAVSVLEFGLERPGTYEFSAWYPEGQKGQEVVLAIGHGFMKELMGMIFSGIGIFFGSWAIAVTIIVITFIKRRRANK